MFEALVSKLARRPTLPQPAARRALWTVHDVFQRPLRLIEQPGIGSAPLWAADGYDPENLVGISERFLGNADIYTATYTHSENILRILEYVIARDSIPMEDVRTVLDFGSGPGTNTVFPLHQIKPSVRIVATDISLPLLATLSRLLEQHPQRENVAVVAWDCMSGGVTPGSVDLVTGASLLHHLMDPRLAIRSACEALRPGGHAIFVDPFDGAGVVRGLYETLLTADVGRNDRLKPETASTLQLLSRDYAARLGGTEPAHFEHLEDKWLFGPEWMIQHGLEAGFSSVVVRGNQDYEGMYGDYVRTQLRIAAGPSAAELPVWADNLLTAFDASMPLAARRRTILEGTVVMRK